MGWEHEPGTVWRAQELYCLDRLSFDRVSELTGVATSTLKRWADKYQWRERRDELAQVESEIRFNTVLGRKAILERLLTAEDGTVYLIDHQENAWCNLTEQLSLPAEHFQSYPLLTADWLCLSTEDHVYCYHLREQLVWTPLTAS